MNGLREAATLATALGCGLVAGVFFAFSAFVMGALARLPAAQGIAAMQSVNRRAVSPPLMVALFGTAIGCVGLAAWAIASWDDRPAAWTLAASVLYVVGVIVVTIGRNVPLNNRLAALDPSRAEAADRWAGYVRVWTAWNHVRGAAALGATALLIVGLSLD